MTPTPDDRPAVEPLTGDAPIRLAGWILPAPEDRVRLLVGELCLDLARASVVRIDIAPSRPGSDVLLAATVELAPPVQVLDVGPAAVWRGFFRTGPRPFAFAARPGKVESKGHDTYREREAAYMRDHGVGRPVDGPWA
jgi:hypothetical protein